MEGTLATDGKSLREMMRWAGMQPLPGGGGGRFALKAQTVLTGGNFALSNANLELDGNVTEGVLALSTEPRMTLKGTLAADALDLTPYLSNAEVLRANERDWSRAALRSTGLRISISTCASRPRASRSGPRSSGAPASPPICAPAASPSRSARRRPSAAR